MTVSVVISGAGPWSPEHIITNAELVAAYNGYADKFNAARSAEINNGQLAPLAHSSVGFIEKASGIKQRYACIKDAILVLRKREPLQRMAA